MDTCARQTEKCACASEASRYAFPEKITNGDFGRFGCCFSISKS